MTFPKYTPPSDPQAKATFHAEEKMGSPASPCLPVAERGDEDLVELYGQLHARSCAYGTRALHDAAAEAKAEIIKRLKANDQS